jgi:hypothetical protein
MAQSQKLREGRVPDLAEVDAVLAGDALGEIEASRPGPRSEEVVGLKQALRSAAEASARADVGQIE